MGKQESEVKRDNMLVIDKELSWIAVCYDLKLSGYFITIVGGVAGCIIACFVPYKGLINILYGLNGYLGFILIFFMIIYDVKTKMSKKRT